MPRLGAVKYLTIHCAATPERRHVTHEQITQWDKAKFGQTSYHWVIELDGTMQPASDECGIGWGWDGENWSPPVDPAQENN